MRVVAPILAMVCSYAPILADGDDWKTYTSTDGRFSILWPGTPKITQSKTQRTGTARTRYEAPSPGSDLKMFVEIAYLPSDEVKKNGFDGTVKSYRDGLVSALGATVVSEEKIAVGKAKHPAKDYVFRLPDKDITVRLRACLVGNRLYAVTLLASKETAESKLAGKFFDSFTLID